MNPPLVLRVEDTALGFAGPATGGYVMRYDPDGHGGQGDLDVADDPRDALQFSNAQEALELWKKQSTVMPMRPDGKPNRPMTAYTVQVMSLEEAIAKQG